jgi:signal transduction histidine kinase/CheY-like chemotaxis protein
MHITTVRASPALSSVGFLSSMLGLFLTLLLPAAALPQCAELRSTWREQRLQGVDGIVWVRCAVDIPPSVREPGVLLGPQSYGGYEVYANGRLIGRSRGWSLPLAFGFPEVFHLPPGTVQLALRVKRIAWLSDRDADSGPVSGVVMVGEYPALADRMRLRWTDHLMSETPLLILSALFAFVCMHQFLMFARRREEVQHLWFGLLALAFTINTFASTYWIYELTARRSLAVRLTDATGHLAAALAIQFLWPFFSRAISRPLRAYQLSHVALAVFVATWPNIRAVIDSGTIRWLWLLPLLVLAAILILSEMRRGDLEARIIACGGVIMIVVQAAELAHNVLPLRWPFDFSIAAFGFGAVIAAMSIALSFRFRRVHEELDRLRFHLEDEVDERTKELAVARDEALAAARAKSEFLANISHEIRTPMNGVIGMAELLARSPLTADQQTRVKAIEVSGRSLLTLLNDVLDFSRLESRKLTVERHPFRVRSVVDECLEIMTPLAAGKGIALASSIADDTVPAVFGDQHRTRQVLLNLLSNGIKFTSEGRVDVAVQSRVLDDGQIEVRFSVTDTGRGIDGDDLGRLFVAFQQLDGSSSRQYGGAGLGLAISKRLAELMGGSIGVETAAGKGSTFHFTIIGDRADAALLQASELARAPRAARGPLRVLLVEDEAINQLVILDMLERLGHEAHCVENGVEALRAVEHETYDVVLMDIQMPDLDGLEVTRRIRETKGDRPPIIALTAHALSGDRERCLTAGMNDYLSKPVRMSALQDALANV